MTDLQNAGLPYVLYQLNECDLYYSLMIVNDIEFSIDIEKGTACSIDYENNYKANGIVCNAASDEDD